MSTDALPLSRPVAVDRLPPEGTTVTVEATAPECAALAADFKLPAVHALIGDFRLTGTPHRVHVAGRVRGRVTQICVVTLDPFDADVEEEVDLDFTEAEAARAAREQLDLDPPDAIVDGRIDLGALTAEFLALGLDPYPRKPGVVFAQYAETPADSPFAALERLKREP